MGNLPFDYAVRNLGRNPTRLLLSLIGSAVVVLLVICAAAFVRGMNQSLVLTGSENNVIVLGVGSEESIERSEIESQVSGIVAASLTGLKERLGQRYVSPEVHLALAVKATATAPKSQLTVVRGIEPVAYLVHPQVQIIEGSAPEAGAHEILVGAMVASKLGLPQLNVGDSLWIDGHAWRISGLLSAPQSVMDAEIWMPLTDLQVLSQRSNLSCVVITLDPARGGDVSDVEVMAAQRLDLEITAMRESEYYGALAEFFGPIRWMVLVTAALIALGGVLGGLNTLYAAFASRVREVGTLQVFGYRRGAIILSILQESLLTTAAGSLLAALLALVFLDGLAVRFSMGAFGLHVDAPVLSTGILAGLVLGFVGTLPPAVRCLRLPVSEALKA